MTYPNQNNQLYTSSKVSITPCSDYTETNVMTALECVLAPLGGWSFVKPGMNIVLKANLVSAMKPEKCATTHPIVLLAIAKQLSAKGAHVIIGDSPGGLYNAGYLSRVYRQCGLESIQNINAETNQDFSEAFAEFPNAHVLKTFHYTGYLDRADCIINVSKLKSHGMMGMSNATKNLFGVIPGTMKPEYHYRFPNQKDFSDMIVDLNDYFRPYLCIVDAIDTMEGNGPTQGTPHHIGGIIAGFNPHAVDLVCAHIIGLTKDEVPTLTAAFSRSLIPSSYEQLELYGHEHLEVLTQKQFETPAFRTTLLFGTGKNIPFGQFLDSICKKALSNKPKLKPNLCIGCKTCADLCPAKAISMKKRGEQFVPAINRNVCIQCFCCQEFCPKGALFVHRTLIARMCNRTSKKHN